MVQAVVSWTDVADETGYKVERSDDDSPFVQVGSTVANVVSFNEAGLLTGVQYCYRVTAFNAFGDGPPSAQACATANVPGVVVGVQVLLSP